MKTLNTLLLTLYATMILFIIGIYIAMILFIIDITSCKGRTPPPKKAEISQIEFCVSQRLFITIDDDLLTKIAWLESEFDQFAIGDNGKAKGMYQLWNSYIQEHNRLYGTSYVHDDAFCPYTSRHIVKGVLVAMAKNYYKNEGRIPNEVELLAMHNGGYRGYKKNTSLPYIQRYYSEIVTKKLHLQK